MTDRFKDALDKMPDNTATLDEFGLWAWNFRNELQHLATEAEQLRKERAGWDELAKAVVASSELTSWAKQEKYMDEYFGTIELVKRIIENGNA